MASYSKRLTSAHINAMVSSDRVNELLASERVNELLTSERIGELVQHKTLNELMDADWDDIYLSADGNGMVEPTAQMRVGVYKWSGYYYEHGAPEIAENRKYIEAFINVFKSEHSANGVYSGWTAVFGGMVLVYELPSGKVSASVIKSGATEQVLLGRTIALRKLRGA